MQTMSQKVFATVVTLTLISGATSLYLSGQSNLTPAQIRVFETAATTWQTGIGAVFGLLGGKGLSKPVKRQ